MRPNRARRKTTIWLGPDDLENIEKLKRKGVARTASAAIRYALHAASKEHPPTVRVGYRILKWAQSLMMLNRRERLELYELGKELYDIAQRKATNGKVTTKDP